jgi:hypothetical protein
LLLLTCCLGLQDKRSTAAAAAGDAAADGVAALSLEQQQQQQQPAAADKQQEQQQGSAAAAAAGGAASKEAALSARLQQVGLGAGWGLSTPLHCCVYGMCAACWQNCHVLLSHLHNDVLQRMCTAATSDGQFGPDLLQAV